MTPSCHLPRCRTPACTVAELFDGLGALQSSSSSRCSGRGSGRGQSSSTLVSPRAPTSIKRSNFAHTKNSNRGLCSRCLCPPLAAAVTPSQRWWTTISNETLQGNNDHRVVRRGWVWGVWCVSGGCRSGWSVRRRSCRSSRQPTQVRHFLSLSFHCLFTVFDCPSTALQP